MSTAFKCEKCGAYGDGALSRYPGGNFSQQAIQQALFSAGIKDQLPDGWVLAIPGGHICGECWQKAEVAMRPVAKESE